MLKNGTYICVRGKVNCDLHVGFRTHSTSGGVKGGRAQFSMFTPELSLVGKMQKAHQQMLLLSLICGKM